MRFNKSPLFLIVLTAALAFAGCSRIFEHDYDVQARQALWDLMKVQEAYHKEHNTYARNLVQLGKYNLKYHTGIVYLEIEDATKDGYRAIALPAESVTARVFAYDTDKGGFYEMGEEEVSQYVLGALNHIRTEKRKQNIHDGLSALLLSCLLIIGFRFLSKYGKTGNPPVFASYFLGILPLAWALAAVTHLNKDVTLSFTITAATFLSLGLALLSLILTALWFGRKRLVDIPPSLVGLGTSTATMALFSIGIMIYIFFKFYLT